MNFLSLDVGSITLEISKSNTDHKQWELVKQWANLIYNGDIKEMPEV